MLKSSLMHYRYCCRPPKLTLVRDIIITITASWNYDFRGHSILTPCLGLNQSYSHLLQIAKNYIKALNEMIRQTDADSGIFQEIPSPSQLLQQQQAIKFAFWDTRTLTFQDIHSPSQLQQQQAIKFAFWVTLNLTFQEIPPTSRQCRDSNSDCQILSVLTTHRLAYLCCQWDACLDVKLACLVVARSERWRYYWLN